MPQVEYHIAADEELVSAAVHYEDCEPGLGLSFLKEVDHGLQQIGAHPHAWPVLEGHFRRYLLNRFPFGMVYRATEERIFIIAVMHLHREPDYWRRRV